MATRLEVKTQAQYNTGTSVESSGNTIAFNASSPLGTQPGSAVITLLGGNTGTAYKEYLFTNTNTGTLVYELSVDFTNMVMADGDAFGFFQPRGTASTSLMARLYLRRTGASYFIDAVRYSEGGVYIVSSFYGISLAAYKLKLETFRSSAAGVADARVRLSVNDVVQTNDTGFINYTSAGLVLKTWAGCVSELDSGTSGSFRIGDITIRDSVNAGVMLGNRMSLDMGIHV